MARCTWQCDGSAGPPASSLSRALLCLLLLNLSGNLVLSSAQPATESSSAQSDLLQATVSSSSALLDALQDPNVGRIVLAGDITLDPNNWTPVHLNGSRRVTLTSKGFANFTNPQGPENDSATTLNFSGLEAITVGNGTSLALVDLELVGLKDRNLPEVLRNGTRPTGLEVWPSVDADPGAEIVFTNVLYNYFPYSYTNCGPAAIRERVLSILWPVVGSGNAGVMPDGITTFVLGTHNLSLPVMVLGANGTAVGNMSLVLNGTASTCQPEATFRAGTDSMNSSSSGDGDSTAWWVWLLVALASVLVVAALSAAVGWRLAKHRLDKAAAGRSAHAQGPPSDTSAQELSLVEMANGSGVAIGSPSALALAPQSALRIRFGFNEEEQIELGALIGKGGYGRVYRARWRGAPAAVKVVEHSGQSMPSVGQDGTDPATAAMPWESVLGAALSHPNIVSTYRVSTVQLKGGWVAQPASDTSSFKSLNPALSGSSVGSAAALPATSSRQLSSEAAGVRESEGEAAWASVYAGSPSPPGGTARDSTPRALFETWAVMEYCDRGSLADAIKAGRFQSRTTGRPNMRAVLLCLADVARGMAYLHSAGVVHGDLKAGNVLLKSREDSGRGFTCKLADFGLSRLLDPTQTQLHTQTIGTIGYMPPEVLTHGRVGTATDVYSCGILMFELAAGQLAFSNETAAQVFYRVVNLGERPVLPEGLRLPSAYVCLMQRCWATDPAERYCS